MTWLGLSGKAGAGKDTFFEKMKEKHPWLPIVRVSFADQLRHEIEEQLNYGMRIEGLWNKPISDGARAIQQFYGVYKRELDADHWVNRAVSAAELVEQGGGIPVFTDVRFPNEAEAIRAHGGIIVRLECPSNLRKARLGGKLPPEHISETALDDYKFDFLVTTDSMDGYYQSALTFFADMVVER